MRFLNPCLIESLRYLSVPKNIFVETICAVSLTDYSTHAIITHSWFETALDYKPRILGPNIKGFPFIVHKLPIILTALQYKPQWKMRITQK